MTDDSTRLEDTPPAPSLAELDAAYRPFPPFREWAARSSVDKAVWSGFFDRLNDARSGGTGPDFDAAVEMAMRSAAVQTGAIEGLYQVDRGITYSIATQAIAWQAIKDSHGLDIRGHFEAQLAA